MHLYAFLSMVDRSVPNSSNGSRVLQPRHTLVVRGREGRWCLGLGFFIVELLEHGFQVLHGLRLPVSQRRTNSSLVHGTVYGVHH